ncbi:MAG: hypothetical protein ACFBSF_11615 [Leptolyngbyaceae cyanobacterium]
MNSPRIGGFRGRTQGADVLVQDLSLPDLLVGLLLTVVLARSAGTVLSQSWRAIA